MIAVAEKNYLENESLKKLVVESLEEGLQKENSQFYILRHNGEIVAFCRFDDEKEYFYAGSFNVDPDYRGSAIGEVMMKESLDKKAQEKPVHAITNPEKKICSKYVEDEGFIIGGILYTEFEGKTLEEVDIIRDDENNKKYAYRQNGITRENLLDIYREQKNSKRADIIKSKSPFIVQFTKDEMSRFLNVADKLCKEYGYVITRYLPVDKNEERMFATFEQKL
jgi:predicted GNAT family N-acyltransferase